MSADLKLLGKVCAARKRLRDVAAGRVDEAEARRRAAEELLKRASGDLLDHLDHASERLSGSGTALLRFEWERTLLVADARSAERSSTAATAQSTELRGQLMVRERALRSTEKVRERVASDRERDADKAEQISSDDLSGSRSRR